MPVGGVCEPGIPRYRAQDNSFNLKIEADYDATLGLVNVVPQNLSRVVSQYHQ
jgi:hypothetical protein